MSLRLLDQPFRRVPGAGRALAGDALDTAWGADVLHAERCELGGWYATWTVFNSAPWLSNAHRRLQPYSLDRMHYSKLYDYTPMPYSIFFLRGYAIHGTTEVCNLGRPVSHGCVRLRCDNAKVLFELIGSYGIDQSSSSHERPSHLTSRAHYVRCRTHNRQRCPAGPMQHGRDGSA